MRTRKVSPRNELNRKPLLYLSWEKRLPPSSLSLLTIVEQLKIIFLSRFFVPARAYPCANYPLDFFFSFLFYHFTRRIPGNVSRDPEISKNSFFFKRKKIQINNIYESRDLFFFFGHTNVSLFRLIKLFIFKMIKWNFLDPRSLLIELLLFRTHILV